MPLRTLFLYLIGNRQAILAIAHNRNAIWIGLLFVLSAGFAREYDQEDLFSNPKVLLLPLGASLLAATVLFLLATLIRWRVPTLESLGNSYRAFLSLFWMTAPLAWLYAVPYEELFTPMEAAKANLITLGVVSLWRVLLMVRVLQVWMGYPLPRAFCLVALFGNCVAFVGLFLSQISLVGLMGGVGSLPPHEQLLYDVSEWLLGASLFAIPAWFFGLIISLYVGTITQPAPSEEPPRKLMAGRGLWVLAVFSLVIWAGVFPFTQSKPILAARVETLYETGQINRTLALMSEHSPNDFPPGWQPPPDRPEHNFPAILETLEEIRSDSPARWVREAYLEKVRYLLRSDSIFPSDEIMVRLIELLESIPGGDDVIQDAIDRGSESGDRIHKLLQTREAAKKQPEQSQ